MVESNNIARANVIWFLVVDIVVLVIVVYVVMLVAMTLNYRRQLSVRSY